MRVDLRKARAEQIKLSEKIIVNDNFEKIKKIGGCDQIVIDRKVISAIVVCDFSTMKVLATSVAIEDAPISYIPGFRAYREMPAIIEAYNKLEIKPDLLICEGNGILHPLRIGMASQIGLLLDLPTIGIAKNKLCGKMVEDTIEVDKEVRAKLITTKQFARPLIVSPGYKISLKTSIEMLKSCLKGHKLPEPNHLAHAICNREKKKVKNSEGI